jgi:energy-coupling factor transporter ATP-binding protein EcfA2
VRFRYAPKLPDAVADVSFAVGSGETVALVGHSGAGKTTCAHLLLRPRSPPGRNEFIAALPDDYDTVTGELGGRLSGGQRQRIAIARALLKDTPILVLDEAVSNLDTVSEQEVAAAMAAARAGRTTLVIAHRLSTIRAADRIVVLDAGQVAETGSHAELAGRDSAYRALVASHLTGVIGATEQEPQHVDTWGGGTRLALAVAGCGSTANTDPAGGSAGAVTVDNCGRQWTYQQPPQQVVTDYHPVFETMVALGLQNRIVGRTNFERGAARVCGSTAISHEGRSGRPPDQTPPG